jgi:hypothetical protein
MLSIVLVHHQFCSPPFSRQFIISSAREYCGHSLLAFPTHTTPARHLFHPQSSRPLIFSIQKTLLGLNGTFFDEDDTAWFAYDPTTSDDGDDDDNPLAARSSTFQPPRSRDKDDNAIHRDLPPSWNSSASRITHPSTTLFRLSDREHRFQSTCSYSVQHIRMLRVLTCLRQTFYYPAFNAARSEDALKFAHVFWEVLAIPVMLEVVMHVRASRGVFSYLGFS